MLKPFLQRFSFIPLIASEEIIFVEDVFAKLAFQLPLQAILSSGLDKTEISKGRLLKEHF